MKKRLTKYLCGIAKHIWFEGRQEQSRCRCRNPVRYTILIWNNRIYMKSPFFLQRANLSLNIIPWSAAINPPHENDLNATTKVFVRFSFLFIYTLCKSLINYVKVIFSTDLLFQKQSQQLLLHKSKINSRHYFNNNENQLINLFQIKYGRTMSV